MVGQTKIKRQGKVKGGLRKVQISRAVQEILERNGSTQAWAIRQMNRINPSLEMTRNKLSTIICGSRKMTADELLAFCKATGTTLEFFYQDKEEEPCAII